MKEVCLLTGGPGVGKTTIIKESLRGLHGTADGFFTEEIRTQGVRQGFRLVTLGGQEAILAHVDIRSPRRVGKYGVDLEGLDNLGVAALRHGLEHCDLVVIDEIGKMELFSALFRQTVAEVVAKAKQVLGTVLLTPHPWADDIKKHPRVSLVLVTRENRPQVKQEVERWLKSQGFYN